MEGLARGAGRGWSVLGVAWGSLGAEGARARTHGSAARGSPGSLRGVEHQPSTPDCATRGLGGSRLKPRVCLGSV